MPPSFPPTHTSINPSTYTMAWAKLLFSSLLLVFPSFPYLTLQKTSDELLCRKTQTRSFERERSLHITSQQKIEDMVINAWHYYFSFTHLRPLLISTWYNTQCHHPCTPHPSNSYNGVSQTAFLFSSFNFPFLSLQRTSDELLCRETQTQSFERENTVSTPFSIPSPPPCSSREAYILSNDKKENVV